MDRIKTLFRTYVAPITPPLCTFYGRVKTFLRTYAVLIGLSVSALYICGLVLLGSEVIPVKGIAVPARWNEWGDFFAGFLSPVAIGWFVWTLVVQREELAETRKEMKEARVVWTDQKDQQAKLAQATEEANELQRKALFFAQLPHLDEAIEDACRRLIDALAAQEEFNGWKVRAKRSQRKFNDNEAESRSGELISLIIYTEENMRANVDEYGNIDEFIEFIMNKNDFAKLKSAYELLYQQAKSLNLLPVIRSHQRECARYLGLEPDA